MLFLRCFAFVCLATATSAATERSPLADLADRARALPGEFAADALLRIAAAPARGDAAWKRGLIEEAFRVAAGAQQPFARRNWTGQSGSFDKAFAQGLDTCTLQCRAVHAMLALDLRKARALFGEIPAPKLPPLLCDDALVYDVSVFYEALGEVAQQTFSAKEIADDEPVRLYQRYVADLTSPVQAGPIARMLAGAALKPAQLEALTDSFAGALKQLPGDDRAFSSTISGAGEGSAVKALAEACERQRINPVPLLEAWRAYLVRHLSGARCADTVPQTPASPASGMTTGVASAPPVQWGLPGAARFFNENMRTGDLRAISNDEVQPSKAEGKATEPGRCDSPQCRQLAKQFAGLLVGSNGLALTPEQKATGDWGGKLKTFLGALADWKGDDPAECFLWKSRFYSDLFDLASNGPDRDAMLSALLTWLQQSDYQRDHRVEWFYPVNVLIIRTFSDPLGMKTTMRDLRNSTDPVISLYAQLEQILPRPIDRTIGLL